MRSANDQPAGRAGMPNDPTAELEVMAAVLVEPSCLDTALECGMASAKFYNTQNAALWALITDIRKERGTYDEALLVSAMRADAARAERCGGMGHFSALLDRRGTSVHLPEYCAVVDEKYRLRRVIEAARDVEAAAYVIGADPAEVEAVAEVRMLAAMRADAKSTMVDLGDLMDRVWTGAPIVTTARTGVEKLDMAIGGLNRGYMTIIPARPSMGKSSLARQIVAHGIMQDVPRRQQVFSLEGPKETFASLLAAELLGMGSRDMEAALKRGQYIAAREDVDARMRFSPLRIDDSPSPTVADVIRRVRSDADKYGRPDVVLIDHWHLMTHPRIANDREDTAQERGSRALRALAKELDTCLVVLAQLTKAGAGIPTMEDIRECDALAQDAAQIIAPYRPKFRSGEVARADEEALLVVIKNRYGPTGHVNCNWNGRLTRYV